MRHFVSACLLCYKSREKYLQNSYSKMYGSRQPSRFNLSTVTAALPRLWINRARPGQRLWYRLYFSEINRKCATGKSVMLMLLHWYCHRSLGCGKMIKFTLKNFKIFVDVYTRDRTISLCQRDASAQIVTRIEYSNMTTIVKYEIRRFFQDREK